MKEPEQLGISVSSWQAVVETRAAEAIAEIRAMAKAAVEFINRSLGQKVRRMREQQQREVSK